MYARKERFWERKKREPIWVEERALGSSDRNLNLDRGSGTPLERLPDSGDWG